MSNFKKGVYGIYGSLSLFLIILTGFYQHLSKNTNFTNTFFSDNGYKKNIIAASIVCGLISGLTKLYVLGSRNLFSIYMFLMIFLVMTMISLCEESSGINMWLNNKNTSKGKGHYAILNDINPNDICTQEIYLKSVNQKNPYISSIINTFFVVSAILFIYFIWLMISDTFAGYSSGKNNINDSLFWDGNISPTSGFFLECIIMSMSGLSPIISAMIKDDEITNYTYIESLVYSFGSIALHIMFQYTGTYKK